jgi:uncharacterized membrane protein YccC
MTGTLEDRIDRLEQDVGNLKRLASARKELSDLKANPTSVIPSKKRNGLRIFLFLLVAVLIAFWLAMPILTAMISEKFSSIGTSIITGG